MRRGFRRSSRNLFTSIRVADCRPPARHIISDISCRRIVTLAALLMYQLGLVRHEELLLRSVLDIYQSVGLEHESLAWTIAHPLENPGIATTIVALSLKPGKAGPAFWVIRTFVLAIFLGLPLLSQLAVTAVMIKAGYVLWAVLVLVSFGVSLWCTLLYFAKGVRNCSSVTKT